MNKRGVWAAGVTGVVVLGALLGGYSWISRNNAFNKDLALAQESIHRHSYKDAATYLNSASGEALFSGQQNKIKPLWTQVYKALNLESAKSHLATAHADQSHGDMQQAIDEFSKAEDLAYSSSSPKLGNEVKNELAAAQIRLAKTYAAKHRWKDALSELSVAKSNGADITQLKYSVETSEADFDVDRLTSEAKHSWQNGQFQQAIDTLNKATTLLGHADKIRSVHSLLETYKSQQAAAELQHEKDNMKKWEGDGDVKIAVGNVDLHDSTELHTAASGMTFVYLYVGVYDDGLGNIQANPINFTLSTDDGNTVSIDDDMFNVSGYLDATDLSTGQQAAGWIVFYTSKASHYTLNYNDYSNTAHKTVIP